MVLGFHRSFHRSHRLCSVPSGFQWKQNLLANLCQTSSAHSVHNPVCRNSLTLCSRRSFPAVSESCSRLQGLQQTVHHSCLVTLWEQQEKKIKSAALRADFRKKVKRCHVSIMLPNERQPHLSARYHCLLWGWCSISQNWCQSYCSLNLETLSCALLMASSACRQAAAAGWWLLHCWDGWRLFWSGNRSIQSMHLMTPSSRKFNIAAQRKYSLCCLLTSWVTKSLGKKIIYTINSMDGLQVT